MNFPKYQVGRAQRAEGDERCSEERLVAPAVEGADEAVVNEESDVKDLADEMAVQGDIVADEVDEAAPLRVPTIPIKPQNQAEVEDHRRSHWPYRSWCKWCNMGRGLGEQRGGRSNVHTIPIIGMDYFYITSEGFKWRKELKHPETVDGEKQLLEDRKHGNLIKCILVRCQATKCTFAHVVPCKGDDEDSYVRDLVCSDVAWLGHVKLLLKSDNERALVALVKRALVELKCQIPDLENVSDETSMEYDSQANGATEVGIKTVRGQFRTLKLCLEDRLEQEIPVKHPLTSWILEHAAFVLNVCARGTDGLTAWARARGRDFGGKLYAFGEAVFWKPPPKGPGHDPMGNMGPRMFPGSVLGFHRSSNAYWVLNDKGDMVKSRALNSRPNEDRWNKEALMNLTVTPWCLRVRPGAERVPLGDPVLREPTDIKDVVTNPRQLKITMKLLKDFGTTRDCPQCGHIRAFQEAKPGLSHSAACRKRLMEDMSKTDEGRAKLEEYEHRVNRAIAERHDGLLDAPDLAPGALDLPDAAGAVPLPEGIPDPRDELEPDVGPVAAGRHARFEEENRRTRESYPAPGGHGLDIPQRAMDADESIDASMDLIESNDDCMIMLAHIGVETKNYRKEHRKAFRRVISEVYSPPRVTKLLSALPPTALAPGFALDLTCIDPDDGKPWDFNVLEKRQKAIKMTRDQKPLFLILSPMCTAFCTWQRLNAQKCEPGRLERKLEIAREHLQYAAQLCREQVEGGRYFLFEHPKFASWWAEPCMKELQEIKDVEVIHADQCQLGAEVISGVMKGRPIKKPTGFMSNAPKLLECLGRRCAGRGGDCSRRRRGRHVICEGRVAREAARYSKPLCKAIIKGMIDQMHYDGIARPGEVGLNAVTDDAEDTRNLRGHDQGYSGQYKDDITGQVLKDELVREARAKELKYFWDKGVWTRRPKHEARQKTGRKAISVRWVDVNKGDDLNPRYRSRLVARQLKAHDRSGASFFAPTPPLEALRTVISMTASTMPEWRPCYDPKSEKRVQISMVDIARAYFNAEKDKDDETYVDLPPEEEGHEQYCAKLLRHMYGTRSAADGWQEEYSSFLVKTMEFEQGMSSPCLFRHPLRQLVCSVHGDDFTTTGAKHDLDWFEDTIKQHYECTIQPRLGPGDADAKEGIVLNRVIRWTDEGIEYESDPRQTEKLIAECGLAGSNTVATPGVRLSFDEATKIQPLEARLHTAFRGAAARANYLAADRIDVQFAAKEICRCMAQPNHASWNALKRLCRYLVGLPRLVFVYRWQTVDAIDVYTDTDWAGCPRTRKSTSGGCILVGGHAVKSWSSTQSNVSLSSGEAEFNGVVRGSGAGLGYQSLLRDLGQDLPVRVWTDSSSAMGTCSRQGLGKLRHLDTHTLWVQQAVRSRRIQLLKIAGEVNPADVFTKHSLSRDRLMKLTKLFDCKYMSGRAASAPQMRSTSGTRVTMAEANAVEEEDHSQGEKDPEMPHRVLARDALERLHPLVVAPHDLHQEPDLHDDDCDGIIVEGERVAKEIMEEAKTHGRRRRARGAAQPRGDGAEWSRSRAVLAPAARPGAPAVWSREASAARPGTATHRRGATTGAASQRFQDL